MSTHENFCKGAMAGVKSCEKFCATADSGESCSRDCHRVGGTANLVVQPPEVNCQPFLLRILLVDDNHRVAPFGGLHDRFENAMCQHVVQLILDLRTVGKRDGSGAVDTVRLGIWGEKDVHGGSVHGRELAILVKDIGELLQELSAHTFNFSWWRIAIAGGASDMLRPSLRKVTKGGETRS